MRRVAVQIRVKADSCPLRSDVAPFGKVARLLAHRLGIDASPADFMGFGLSCQEISDLDIREPMASEIAEHLAASRKGPDGLVDAVHTVLGWHIQDIDRQLEMLLLRRRSLERKVRAVERLAQVVSENDKLRPAM